MSRGRTFREFLFGEDFSSWYVPEVSKLEYMLKREIKQGFLEAVNNVKDGMPIDEAWEAFSELHSKKHAEYGRRIAEAKHLRLIIPFYRLNVLKRIAVKWIDSRYASLCL